MSNELPKTYDPSVIEERWAEYWVREQLFDVATPAAGTPDSANKFTILLPPPNVTGRLHMGHMLNHTEMDILTRWHRMRGETALWVPGTDHAGIATQMMVERQLAGEGKTRQQLGREAFIDRVWDWRQHYGGAILDQMKRLGASVDWSREYFTMDERLNVAVREAFVRLYKQGLIYRDYYIVNWDIALQTAVSDLEVTHEEQTGKLYYIRYPFESATAPYNETNSIMIATTRPETMLGDVAIAVNPSDQRYIDVIGKHVVLPLKFQRYYDDPKHLGTDEFMDGEFVRRKLKIIADDWANPEFGTGAVKITPAHDPNDFEVGRRHSLEPLIIMDVFGKINHVGGDYEGKDRFKAREEIVEALRESGALVEVKDHTLSIGISQRTGTIIEPYLSQQWFLKIQPLADKAIEAVDKGYIKFMPEQYRKTYDEWMKNIHDWCISRQLWWGHRIPAWSCVRCPHITVCVDKPISCEGCGEPSPVQETDVLDTWFSSGLLPFTVFGWPNPNPDTGMPSLPTDLAAFYPTQLLVTGSDILFFWVARMIMLSCHFMLDVPMPDGSKRELKDAVPFREVYIHALVRDADRQKMSKTKGNVINPIGIVQKYGTDAVRFTLASMASPGTDIAFSEARTEGYRAFANKIWNAARFLFMQIDRAKEAGYAVDPASLREALKPAISGGAAGAEKPASLPWTLPENTPLETRWIFTRLSAVSAEVNRALTDYRFDEAANAIYQFFWGEFCDWYLELVKLRLEFGEGTEKNETTALTLASLVSVFESALRLLSPFMPFLTEEIWHALYNGATPAKSIALTHYPQAANFPAGAVAEIENAMKTLQDLIVTVRGLRKDLGVPEKEATPVQLHGANRILALADANSDMLARMARVQAVEFASEPLTGSNARSTAEFDVAVVYERQIDVAAERERLTKDLAKFEKGLTAAERQLGNEAFMAKAPAHIVDGLRKQAAETKLLYDKTKAALNSLPE